MFRRRPWLLFLLPPVVGVVFWLVMDGVLGNEHGSSGTKVDAYMEFGDEDWYITIKRGLKNQQRLILQGEIEDIILHAPRRDRDLWVCVVVGLSDEEDANELAHFKALCDYAAQRSIVDGYHRETQGGRRIHIEVMHAIIPSTELTPEELQELELAPA